MKKMILILLAVLLSPTGVFAASFNINENKNEDLADIRKIVFDLKSPNCAICISTGRQSYSFTGGGRPGILSLSLEGDLKSNNKKAVPSIITSREGDILYVRLFGNNNLFFGLVQSGSVHMHAELPDYFNGDITIKTSSGNSTVADLNLKSFMLDSSSGDNELRDIEAEKIVIELSSGNVTAENLASVGGISIKSSSGDLNLDELLSESAEVRASSGRINIQKLRCTGNLNIHASSGRISAGHLEGGAVAVDATSGSITIKELQGKNVQIEASSGDITLGALAAESSAFEVSSGNTVIGVEPFKGDISVKSSSGDVTIELPADASFTADLNASSGKIRSDFPLLAEITGDRKNEIKGEANGGGYSVRVKASSGNITIKER